MIPLLFALPFMAIAVGTKLHEDGEKRYIDREAELEQNYQIALQSSILFRDSEIQKLLYAAKSEYDKSAKQIEYEKRLDKARAESTLAFYAATEQGLSPDQATHKSRCTFGRIMQGLQDPGESIFVNRPFCSYNDTDELLIAIQNGSHSLHGKLSKKELNCVLSNENRSDLADQNSNGDGA